MAEFEKSRKIDAVVSPGKFRQWRHDLRLQIFLIFALWEIELNFVPGDEAFLFFVNFCENSNKLGVETHDSTTLLRKQYSLVLLKKEEFELTFLDFSTIFYRRSTPWLLMKNRSEGETSLPFLFLEELRTPLDARGDEFRFSWLTNRRLDCVSTIENLGFSKLDFKGSQAKKELNFFLSTFGLGYFPVLIGEECWIDLTKCS